LSQLAKTVIDNDWSQVDACRLIVFMQSCITLSIDFVDCTQWQNILRIYVLKNCT